MRDDMFKVIVERPRWGASHAASPKLKRMPHADTQYIGLKRHARIGAPYTKMLNENLAPLVRYLRRQRGRRWDAVFSEMCASLDTGSVVKMHVRQHIEDFVLTRISIGRQGEWMFEGQVLGRKGQWFTEIAAKFDMAMPSISKHLSVLKDAGLVHEQKRGQFVLYSIAADHMANLLYGFLTPFCPEARKIVKERRTSGRKRGHADEA